jgi:hypothetical protein
MIHWLMREAASSAARIPSQSGWIEGHGQALSVSNLQSGAIGPARTEWWENLTFIATNLPTINRFCSRLSAPKLEAQVSALAKEDGESGITSLVQLMQSLGLRQKQERMHSSIHKCARLAFLRRAPPNSCRRCGGIFGVEIET